MEVISMKVLLINPESPSIVINEDYGFPSSLLYLSAMLRKNGIDVNILDLNISKRKKGNASLPDFYENVIKNKIIDFKPSLVGLTCFVSGNFPRVRYYSKKIKEWFKEVPIVVGGIHPTTYPVEILTYCSYIDYVILGEGENSLSQLAESIGKNDVSVLSKIDGFAYRKEGKVLVHPKTSFITDLDSMPFPDYEQINMQDYYHDTALWRNPKGLSINARMPIFSSRSCPRRCNFCSMFHSMGPKWRSRTAKNVIDEIEYIYNRYNHRYFTFIDDNFTLDKSRAIEICKQIIDRKMDIQFEALNGVATGTLDSEILDALYLAGMRSIYLAIESGSDFIRNHVMGKGLSDEKIFEVVQLAKKFKDLHIKAGFIIGMPEDTRETLDETYNMIKKIDVDQTLVTNLIIFAGTRVFEQASRDNLFFDNVDVSNLWEGGSLQFMEGNKNFMIKPYKMELTELSEYRAKFDELMETANGLKKNRMIVTKRNNN